MRDRFLGFREQRIWEQRIWEQRIWEKTYVAYSYEKRCILK
ncbi:hypothetical protein [Moorena sp. SIO4A5]|nr:hypothetical protein [Moorena sp. SIO4A5]